MEWAPKDVVGIVIIIAATVFLSITVWHKPINRENTVRSMVFIGIIFASIFIFISGGLSDQAAPIWALFGGMAGYMARGFGGNEPEDKK